MTRRAGLSDELLPELLAFCTGAPRLGRLASGSKDGLTCAGANRVYCSECLAKTLFHTRPCLKVYRDKLQNVFKRLRGKGALNEQDVNDALREVRLALLEADVNFKVVKDFIGADPRARGRRECWRAESGPAGRQDRRRGADGAARRRAVAADLRAPRRRRSSCSAACRARAKRPTRASSPRCCASRAATRCWWPRDIYRPAAIKQLQVVGEQVKTPVFTLGDKTDPAQIAAAGRGRGRATAATMSSFSTRRDACRSTKR